MRKFQCAVPDCHCPDSATHATQPDSREDACGRKTESCHQHTAQGLNAVVQVGNIANIWQHLSRKTAISSECSQRLGGICGGPKSTAATSSPFTDVNMSYANLAP